MKRNDLFLLLFIALLFCPFLFFQPAFSLYNDFNKAHGMVMSFLKFAILATMGEMIALRIRKGVYNEKGFGILPRAIVWGFLGLAIKAAFTIFSSGTPVFMEYLGMAEAGSVIKGAFTPEKLLVAFCISTAMNLVFAPVMMTFHKITDTHILMNGGTIGGFFSPIHFSNIFQGINWDIQWNFVFKKTIPFFWIPAHTITFLLPPDFQVLFAALLGIALGLILSFASMKAVKR
ncbi:MAG: hypothetical protein HXX13_00605 [Bacteroidetes bacterium]|nr:hypothetical protein [Bacteroidota bacterium]